MSGGLEIGHELDGSMSGMAMSNGRFTFQMDGGVHDSWDRWRGRMDRYGTNDGEVMAQKYGERCRMPHRVDVMQ